MQKCLVREIGGRGEKACCLDAGVIADENAVWIDKVDRTVGLEVPEDFAPRAGGNPVENPVIGLRLEEADCFIRGDVKALPMEDRFAVRVNLENLGRRQERCVPLDDLSSGGEGNQGIPGREAKEKKSLRAQQLFNTQRL